MPSLRDLSAYGIPIAQQIAGGVTNSRAAGRATNTLAQGGQQAIDTTQSNNADVQDLLKQIYGDNMKALSPYAGAGGPALDSLTKATSEGGSLVKPFTSADVNLTNDPGMAYRIAEGEKLLERRQASSGSLNSGAARIAQQENVQNLASQEFQNAFNRDFATDNANKQNTLQALMSQIGIGERATNTGVQAGEVYGGQSVSSNNETARAVADLQTQIASANAAGDVAKANALTQTLEGISGAVSNQQGMKTLADLLKGGGPAGVAAGGGSIASLPSAGFGLPALTSADGLGVLPAGVLAPASPAIPGFGGAGTAASTAAGSAPLTGYAGGGLVTSHGATIGMLTNPVTIAVAAGILGATALIKSQAHWEANTFTKNVQNPFGQQLNQAVQALNQAARSGQLTKEQGMQAVQQIQGTVQEFERARQEFAGKGKDERKVADQAKASMDKYFGPNYSKLLTDLNAQVQGLAA